MAPPQWFLSKIHRQYSALGRPRKASEYVSGSPDTAAAITRLLE